jgi:hypothetical protein
MRRRIVKDLNSLDAVAVENPAKPGTPDVNFAEGWIELKWLRAWKASNWETPVLIPHFTPQQRVFLMKRWRVAQSAWMLLQVGHEWLLFDGEFAAEYVGRVTRQALIEGAVKHWPNGLKKNELIECLTLASSRN